MRLFFIFVVIFFVSCSYKKNDRCSINGKRNYLNTDPLNIINIPNDFSFLFFDREYDIPVIDDSEIPDEYLSICPPNIVD